LGYLKTFRLTYRGKKYSESLPILARVAKRVFSIPSGSANMERIFSLKVPSHEPEATDSGQTGV
jgi:hypothetical protein